MPACSMSGLLSTTCARRADRAPGVLRRVAVVGEHADGLAVAVARRSIARPGRAARRAGPAPAPWSGRDTTRGPTDPEDRVEDRRVVAQRLARRGRRDDDGAAAGAGRGRSPRPDACRARGCRAVAQRADQPAIERLGHRRVHRGGRRQPPDGGDHDIARDGRMPVGQAGRGRGRRHARPRRRRLEQRPGRHLLRAQAAQGVQDRLLGVGRFGDRQGAGRPPAAATVRDEGGGGIRVDTP